MNIEHRTSNIERRIATSRIGNPPFLVDFDKNKGTPIDIFDLFYHLAPMALLAVKVYRDYAK
ncbi:MAG: hypothetical protein JRH03_06420 [Deltaproteobacteria bacterium]|nr:hypothetical protein [Deltaproteobacteria bacterium]